MIKPQNQGTQQVEEPKLKSARRLHDQSKRNVKSERPTNIYKEFIIDDETGNGGHFVWYTTESGKYVGRTQLTRYNESTMQTIEEGFEYTIPYTKKKAQEIAKTAGRNAHYYHKDGETTIDVRDAEHF